MKYPAIFLGHGSPMNAIDPNSIFNQGFLTQAARFPKPKAILMISAHWYGNALQVMTGENNPIMYDFYGFPQALFDTTYPAKGSPELAQRVQQLLTEFAIQGDEKRGLDHGAWAVLRHFYPDADVPVVQLSLNLSQPAQWHWQVAQALKPLRNEGILILASGNIVHNLRELNHTYMDEPAMYEWADTFRNQINHAINTHDIDTLLNYDKLGKIATLSVPAPAEHYLPLLYIMAQRDEQDETEIFNDVIIGGSLSMTSVRVG